MKRIMTLVMGLMMLPAVAMATPNSSNAIQKMDQMPLAFTKNMGQWDDRVLFRANAGGATMWFTTEGVTYQFTRSVGRGTLHVPAGTRSVPLQEGMDSRFRGNDMEKDSIEQLVLTAKFVGANPNPDIIAESQMEYKCNYFLGNDPAKWHTDVPNYEAITLKDIYPGIDLKYSGDGTDQAAYEFIAAPGADIAQIKVEYEGAESTSIDADGRMIVRTKWGDMIAAIESPTDGVLSGSASFSQLSEKTIGFEPSASNRLALGTSSVELAYSTYLGGGSTEYGNGITVDGNGNAYVTGQTYSSDFPTMNPYQGTFQGGNCDVFVTKLSSSGNNLIYSTYLGGTGEEYGYGIAVDGSGNAYVTGCTWSSEFPVLNPFQTDRGSVDAFVTKLSSSGSALIYSSYLGGSAPDYGDDIAVDGDGSAFITGTTSSSDFPTLNPYQATFQGGDWDIFVTKVSSSGNALIFSTYLGGGGDEEALAIALDNIGSAYVTGGTISSDFPTMNPYQTYQGGYDAFVTKFSSSGNSLIYSTYLGGGGEEEGKDIVIDGGGYAYVTGFTGSSDFPTVTPYQATLQGNADVFVTKLSISGNSLIYSTYIGGGDRDIGCGIAVNGSGFAYVTGWTTSSDFPTSNPYQSTSQGGLDVFATKLGSSGNSLIYSTYLGGADYDLGNGNAVDGNGNAYVTGWTGSSDFPTLDPYQADQTSYDAFVTKLHFNAAPVVTPLQDLTQLEGDTISFQVTATDPDSTIPTLTAVNLPANASFVDSGNGHGGFYWPIAPKQYGTFNILFIASDGILADTEIVEIQVSARLPQIANLSVDGSQMPEHVTTHVPTNAWRYIDFNNDDPQLKFEIAVGTDSDWAYSEMWNPAQFNSADTFVVYNGAPLVDGSTYWLRLRVNNSLGWSDWKQLMFRMNSVPTVPQLRLPLTEAIVSSQKPSLIIRNSTDAENDSLLYTFEVSPDNFATTVFTFSKKQDADSLTTLIVDSTLVENAQYWWRAKASDYYESSDWSPVWSFYVNSVNTAPTAVSLTQPANVFVTPLTILRPQFVWTASTDPDPLDSITYDLVIALDSNFLFVQQILNLTATSHTLTTDLLWGKRYWWKVKSLDRHGAFNWSPVFTFRTMTLGDANNDGATDISDVVYLIAYIFSGGLPPTPLRAGDANCDNSVDISDAVYLIAYIFSGGSAPCSAF
jgi:hypothetical protein